MQMFCPGGVWTVFSLQLLPAVVEIKADRRSFCVKLMMCRSDTQPPPSWSNGAARGPGWFRCGWPRLCVCVCVCVCFPVSPSLSSGNQHVVAHRSQRSSFSLTRRKKKLTQSSSKRLKLRPTVNGSLCLHLHTLCVPDVKKTQMFWRETKQKYQVCDGFSRSRAAGLNLTCCF